MNTAIKKKTAIAAPAKQRQRAGQAKRKPGSVVAAGPVVVTDGAIHTRRLLPIKVAAERLGLSVWGLRAWVYSGKCASHKIGDKVCLSEDEVNRIIAESERPRVVA